MIKIINVLIQLYFHWGKKQNAKYFLNFGENYLFKKFKTI